MLILETLEDTMDSSGTAASSSHYLSKIVEQNEARRWLRRDCSLMVRVMFPAQGVRKVAILNARLMDISEGGALAVVPYENIPKHFYMVIGKFQYNIGCVARNIRKEFVHIEFIRIQNTNLINFLSRIDNKFDTLNELKYDFTLFQRIK
jgi:Ni,Fe-hydrogenase maturation factor